MSYSMMGIGLVGFGDDCSGASSAGKAFNDAKAAQKSACDKARELRVKIAALDAAVSAQNMATSEMTQEKVDLFQARKELGPATDACDKSMAESKRLLKAFIDFQASGCFDKPAQPSADEEKGGPSIIDRFKKLVTPSDSAPPVAKAPPVAVRAGWAPCPAQPKRTKKGDSRQAVHCWQLFLISKGFDLGPSGADGDHGNATEQASLAYEASLKQPVAPAQQDGVAPVVAPVVAKEPPPKKDIDQGSPLQKLFPKLPRKIWGVPSEYAVVGLGALALGGYYMMLQRRRVAEEVE